MSVVEKLNQERRITFCLYEFWEKLAGDGNLPALKDMSREQIAPFKNNLMLLDLRENMDEPTFQVVGAALQEDLETNLTQKSVNEVPRRTMLSRVTDHYREVLANRVPIAFEAEFVNSDAEKALYRGILLPFSDDKENINFILGGVRWILEKDLTLDDTKPTIEELMSSIAAGRALPEGQDMELAQMEEDVVTADADDKPFDEVGSIQEDEVTSEEISDLDSVPEENEQDEDIISEETKDILEEEIHTEDIVGDDISDYDVNAELDYIESSPVVDDAFDHEDVPDRETGSTLPEGSNIEEVVETPSDIIVDDLSPEDEFETSKTDVKGDVEISEENVLSESPSPAPSETTTEMDDSPTLTRKEFLPEETEDDIELASDSPETELLENETDPAESTEAERMASEILESLSSPTDVGPEEGFAEPVEELAIDKTDDIEAAAPEEPQNEVEPEQDSASFKQMVENQISTSEEEDKEPTPSHDDLTLIDTLENDDEHTNETNEITTETTSNDEEDDFVIRDDSEELKEPANEDIELAEETSEADTAIDAIDIVEPDQPQEEDAFNDGDDLSIEELMESIIAERKFDASYMREQKATQTFTAAESNTEEQGIEETADNHEEPQEIMSSGETLTEPMDVTPDSSVDQPAELALNELADLELEDAEDDQPESHEILDALEGPEAVLEETNYDNSENTGEISLEKSAELATEEPSDDVEMEAIPEPNDDHPEEHSEIGSGKVEEGPSQETFTKQTGFGEAIPEFLTRKDPDEEFENIEVSEESEHSIAEQETRDAEENITTEDTVDALLEENDTQDDLVLDVDDVISQEESTSEDDIISMFEEAEAIVPDPSDVDVISNVEITQEPQDQEQVILKLSEDQESTATESFGEEFSESIPPEDGLAEEQDSKTTGAETLSSNKTAETGKSDALADEPLANGLPQKKKRGSVIERAMAFINPNFGKDTLTKKEPTLNLGSTESITEDSAAIERNAVQDSILDHEADTNTTKKMNLNEDAAHTDEIRVDATMPEAANSPDLEETPEFKSSITDTDPVIAEELISSADEELDVEAPAEEYAEHAHSEIDEIVSEKTEEDEVDTIEVTDDDIFMENRKSAPFEEEIIDELTSDLNVSDNSPVDVSTEISKDANDEEPLQQVAAQVEETTEKEAGEHIPEDEPVDELTLAALKSTLKQIIGFIKKEDANHNRSRDSLYNILTAIYEFHATCETSPNAYAELVKEHDLKIQSRAPFTPILKICLGKDYDKTRLTEYAAALGIARYMNIDIDEFHAFIKNFPGGIKGCVKEMRIIRKHGATGNITARKTRSVEEAREILREMAPIASFRLKKVIVGNNIDEFCLLLAKRDGHDINVLKILDDKYTKLDPVLKRAAFIKGNLNGRK